MRKRAEGVLAVLFVVVMVTVGAVVVWFAVTPPMGPIHPDAAQVPSTRADARTDTYADPIAEGSRLARRLAADGDLPGLSVAVAVDRDVVWAEGFGWVGVEERTPVTPTTRFRLGALSKPLTAVGAALLHDQGRLDLDAPVQQYVPAYPRQRWTVTTRHLLADVGGVHRIRGDNNDAMPTQHCSGSDEAVDLLSSDPLQFEPGTQHRYSIWGWVLVTAAVQGAAREPFARFMRREVFEPLGMTHTSLDESAADESAHPEIVPWTVMRRRIGQEAATRPDYSCLGGGGAYVSTPSDLVRLGSAMLKPGLLEAGTIEMFSTPFRLASGAPTTYALGWTVGEARLAGEPTRVISHRGSPAAGSVTLLTIPAHGLAVAVAANVTDASGVGQFALRVAEAFATRASSRDATP